MDRLRQLLGPLSFAGLVLGGLVACAGPQAEPPPTPVKVVASFVFGRNGSDEFGAGAQLALEEHRRAGGVQVELELKGSSYADLSASTELERRIAADAIADPAVLAYLGPAFSDSAKVSMPMLNRAGMLQVSYGATWPGLTRPGFGAGEPGIYFPSGRRHFFRVVPTDDLSTPLVARWVSEQGWHRVFVVGVDTAFGHGAAGTFATAAQDLGLEVVGPELLPEGAIEDEELVAIARQVLAAAPDGVIFTSTTSSFGSSLVRHLRERAPDLPVLNLGAVMESNFIQKVGPELAQKMYSTALGVPVEHLRTPRAIAFRRLFSQTYGREASFRAGLSYEAMSVILRAIELARPRTREGVLAAMDRLGRVDGLQGPWTFTDTGDISITWSGLWWVEGEEWRFVQVLSDR